MDTAHELLVYKRVNRKVFTNEIYSGQDDILALVESGEFVFESGGKMQQIGPLEAVNFQKNTVYFRKITKPAVIHLFRYHTQSSPFGAGKAVFKDTERIHSTIALLHQSENCMNFDGFTAQKILFADIINQYLLENAVTQKGKIDDPLIRQALTYIDENLHKKISLEKLAEENYLSYIQFSRRFKKAVGVPPQNHINARRLSKAKTMLAETDLSIRQIAQNCGFANEYYFSNFFRKYCNISPSKYRTMMQSTENI